MSHDPWILGLETSSRRGSVALAHGDTLVDGAVFRTDANHAVELLPALSGLCRGRGLRPADIRELYVSVGPGSFTGLRIAVTVARTLALAVDLRVVAVPTLEVIAQNALETDPPPGQVAVLLDAKRGQAYGGVFEHRAGHYRPLHPAALVDPAELLSRLAPPRAVLGEGLLHHASTLKDLPHQPLPEALGWPRAEVVCRLGLELARAGRFIPAAELIPVYLRLPEAEEVWRRRQTT